MKWWTRQALLAVGLIGALALVPVVLPNTPASGQAPGGAGCGVTGTPNCNVNIAGGSGGTVTANQGSPPWSVTQSGSSSTIHDCGGSITTGGTAQQIITSGQFLHGFLIQVGVNDSNTDPLYFSDTTTTPGAGVAGSFSLNPSTTTTAGGSFSTPLNYPVGNPIYINGATTGDKYKCRYF